MPPPRVCILCKGRRLSYENQTQHEFSPHLKDNQLLYSYARFQHLVCSIIVTISTCMHTGQSSSGIDIVALLVSLAIIGIILCVCMPICVICLTVALCCTCRRYRKAKKQGEEHENITQGNKSSIHSLPLPPIPTEDVATTHGIEAYEVLNPDLTLEANEAYANQENLISTTVHGNQAYAVNSLNIALEANQAYGSKVPTHPQESQRLVRLPPMSQTPIEDTEIQGNQAYAVNSFNLTLEANQAYGSNLDQEESRGSVHVAARSPVSTENETSQGSEADGLYIEPTNEADKSNDYLKLLSDNQEPSVSRQLATTPDSVESAANNTDGSDYYNYYEYI